MVTPPNGSTGRGRKPADPAGPAAAPRPADQWADWITIWESELNALAGDREALHLAQTAWAKTVAFWAAQARAAASLFPDAAGGSAAPEPPPRPAPAAAASGPGQLAEQQRELERLARRVEELERRLAGSGG